MINLNHQFVTERSRSDVRGGTGGCWSEQPGSHCRVRYVYLFQDFISTFLPPAYVVRREGMFSQVFVCPQGRGGSGQVPPRGGYPGQVHPPGGYPRQVPPPGGVPGSGTPPGGTQVQVPPGGGTRVRSPLGGYPVPGTPPPGVPGSGSPPGGYPGQVPPPRGGTRVRYPPGGRSGYPPGGVPGGVPRSGYPPRGGYPGRTTEGVLTTTAGGMPLAFTQEDFLVPHYVNHKLYLC